MRTKALTEPLHPRRRKQASEIERRRGQRFQAVATDLPGRHYPKLDALHRNHARAETVIKDAKNLGLTRLPSYQDSARWDRVGGSVNRTRARC